jgi:hypothetical protein
MACSFSAPSQDDFAHLEPCQPVAQTTSLSISAHSDSLPSAGSQSSLTCLGKQRLAPSDDNKTDFVTAMQATTETDCKQENTAGGWG